MAERIELNIDGQSVTVPVDTTIREAALRLGIQTPTLCYHPHLRCGSNCRACVVELEGSRTLVPACSRPAAPGMKIRTDSERVNHSRKMVFELLMTEVDTSAAPELVAYAHHYGADPGRYPVVSLSGGAGADPGLARADRGDTPDMAGTASGRSKERPVIMDNPFFVRDYAKCIACQRCVRACGDDVQHTFAIAMIGQGHQISVGAGDEQNDITRSSCVFCGNCVGVCPTGALMPLAEFDARRDGLLESAAVDWTPQGGFTGPGATLLSHPDAPGGAKEVG